MRSKVRMMVLGISFLLFGLYQCCSAESFWEKVDENQEKVCEEKGWQKVVLNVNGVERRLLWRGPQRRWRNGAIIVLHGGGGSESNWCGSMRIAKPQAEFSDLANRHGFAVFALDSTDGFFKDQRDQSCGKRFDFMGFNGSENLEFAFFDKVINEVIPENRPQGSSSDIYMAGISNGGFMAIRGATHFDDKIKAFALISAGDPYGTHIDCSPDLTIRTGAPGLFIDNETGKHVGQLNACEASAYPHEQAWDTSGVKERGAFKQFHHEGDAGVDLSCMRKAGRLLELNGYRNDGQYVIKNTSGKKDILKHFWQREYNKPIVDFFNKYKTGSQGIRRKNE